MFARKIGMMVVQITLLAGVAGLLSSCASATVSPAVTAMPPSHASLPRWSVESGGNGHYYQRVDQPDLTFDQARQAASAMTFQGLPGHLAIFETPTYDVEVKFVHAEAYAPGVQDDRVYWVGASRAASAAAGPEGWTWVDGNSVPPSLTTGWNIDFHEGQVAEGATFFQARDVRIWDYDATNSSKLVSGYIVEFEPR